MTFTLFSNANATYRAYNNEQEKRQTWAERLTEITDHHIDFSRIGNLLFSENTHHYSQDEIIKRSAIVAIAAVSGYLGVHINNPKKTHCSNLVVFLAASTLGFTIAHAPVVYPLYQKREAMNQECKQLAAEILAYFDQHYASYGHINAHRQTLVKVINQIQKISLSNERDAKASQTWGRRKNLFQNLHTALISDDFDMAMFDKDPGTIIAELNESPQYVSSATRNGIR